MTITINSTALPASAYFTELELGSVATPETSTSLGTTEEYNVTAGTTNIIKVFVWRSTFAALNDLLNELVNNNFADFNDGSTVRSLFVDDYECKFYHDGDVDLILSGAIVDSDLVIDFNLEATSL